MPSGIDFYSQSRDRYDVEKKKRGNLLDLLSIISLGSGAAAAAGGKSASLSSKFAAKEAAKYGTKVSLGGATSTISSTGGKLAAEQSMKEGIKNAFYSQMAKYLGSQTKKEGLSTLVNNVLPQSGSGVVNPNINPAPEVSKQAFSEWVKENPNVSAPISRGSFLGGLKKGALGMPQSASDTSPWFYAGALVPSVMRSKLGIDTTFDAAYKNKMGNYYDFASGGYGLSNLTPEDKVSFVNRVKSIPYIDKIANLGIQDPSELSNYDIDPETGVITYIGGNQ